MTFEDDRGALALDQGERPAALPVRDQGGRAGDPARTQGMRLPWMTLVLALCCCLGQPATAGAMAGRCPTSSTHGPVPLPIPACGATTPEPGGLAARCRPTATPSPTSIRTARPPRHQGHQVGRRLHLGPDQDTGQVEMVYGRVEASIKMPPGPGILPAFWLLGGDYSERWSPRCGEIDIIEYVQSAFHHTLHGPRGRGRPGHPVWVRMGCRARKCLPSTRGRVPHLLGGAFA